MLYPLSLLPFILLPRSGRGFFWVWASTVQIITALLLFPLAGLKGGLCHQYDTAWQWKCIRRFEPRLPFSP
jgi:hypothetical protein